MNNYHETNIQAEEKRGFQKCVLKKKTATKLKKIKIQEFEK